MYLNLDALPAAYIHSTLNVLPTSPHQNPCQVYLGLDVLPVSSPLAGRSSPSHEDGCGSSAGASGSGDGGLAPWGGRRGRACPVLTLARALGAVPGLVRLRWAALLPLLAAAPHAEMRQALACLSQVSGDSVALGLGESPSPCVVCVWPPLRPIPGPGSHLPLAHRWARHACAEPQ